VAPLTWLIRCQVDPALGPAQSVRQLDPGTVAATVTFALVASLVLTAALVEADARTFTPEQAGTIA
jgi:hypothetical protein